jgi:hypothetical protein
MEIKILIQNREIHYPVICTIYYNYNIRQMFLRCRYWLENCGDGY